MCLNSPVEFHALYCEKFILCRLWKNQSGPSHHLMKTMKRTKPQRVFLPFCYLEARGKAAGTLLSSAKWASTKSKQQEAFKGLLVPILGSIDSPHAVVITTEEVPPSCSRTEIRTASPPSRTLPKMLPESPQVLPNPKETENPTATQSLVSPNPSKA